MTPSPNDTRAAMPTSRPKGGCVQPSQVDQLPIQSANMPSSHDDLEPYAYRPLDQSQNEMRLITIHPGSFNDPLEITLSHVSLHPLPPQPVPDLMSLAELQATLPRGWEVYQTISGRIVFCGPRQGSSWIHPNPHISQAAYDISLHPAPSNGDTPYFEALSYAWGSLYRSVAILVCEESYGLAPSTPAPIVSPKYSLLRIGMNLFEALGVLRLPDKPRVMWVDAICINQDDFEERGQQVARMAQIYSRASRVAAWLGPDDDKDDVSKAFDGLAYIGTQVEYTTNDFIMCSPGASKPTWFHATTELPQDDVFWAPIIKLLDRPWFWRLWVIQEVQMGNSNSYLKSGLYEMPWLQFQKAIICLNAKSRPPISRSQIRRLFTLCNPGKGIIHRMTTAGYMCRYSDPRDIIYGLLSLASPELSEALRIDYHSDVCSVYRQFLTTYNSLENRCDLLLLAGRDPAAVKMGSQFWPSWIVDWQTKIIRMRHTIYKVTSAAGQSCAEFKFEVGFPNRLNIQGVILDDTVSSIKSENIQNLAEFIKMLRNIAKQGVSATSERETYTSRTEIVDKYIDAFHEGLYRGRGRFKSLLSPEIFRRDIIRSPSFSLDSEATHPIWWKQYLVVSQDLWPSTNLFTTKKGFPAVSNYEIQLKPEDCIIIPLGCRSPIAVRRTGDGRNTFQLMGTIYLHGVMHGEVLLGQIPEPWRIGYDRSNEYAKEGVYFENSETGAVLMTDPRLDRIPLPQDWEPVDWDRKEIDPAICCRFRNKATGEQINYDPRMTSKALKERGVDIQEIALI